MKVGIIAPIDFLGKYCSLSTIQYCLPNLLVEEERYRNFYLKRKKLGDFIILDCKKPGWKREWVNFKIVELAIDLIHPNVIISPSYMFDKGASKDLYEEFVEEFIGYDNKIVRCIEGTSDKEIEDPLEGKMAIPSHVIKCVKNRNLGPDTIYIENHLNLEELQERKGILVTSLPVRLGLLGRLVYDYLPSPPSLTFFEHEDQFPLITKRNVEETLEYYKDA